MRTMLRGERRHAAHTGARRYCGVAAAVVGSLGAAAIGGVASNKAAKKGAAAMDRATEANAYQGEIAKEQWDEYKKNYAPLEAAFAKDAANAGNPEDLARAAGDAQATVSTQLGQARERLTRTPGFDPSTPAAQAALAGLEMKGAAMGASAQNSARRQAEAMGIARKQDAISLGKGMVSNATRGMAEAAAGANAQAQASMAQANETAAGFGKLASGVMSGLSKVNFGANSGSYGKFLESNAGVMSSQGLTPDDLVSLG
jgi:hypothetical protein